MKTFILLLAISLLACQYIFATNKVEINTATLEQLDKITGVGPVLAQRIIDARPFSSVDDLLKVKGIGEKTLQKIKDQGLAYAEEQSNPASVKASQNPFPVMTSNPSPETRIPKIIPEKTNTAVKIGSISSNQADIKESVTENHTDFSIYLVAVFVASCSSIIILFLRSKLDKSEIFS